MLNAANLTHAAFSLIFVIGLILLTAWALPPLAKWRSFKTLSPECRLPCVQPCWKFSRKPAR